MPRIRLSLFALAIGIAGIASATYAQGTTQSYSDANTVITRPATPSRSHHSGQSLADRLDSIGKSIFGGILPEKHAESERQVQPRPAASTSRAGTAGSRSSRPARAGSILTHSSEAPGDYRPTRNATPSVASTYPSQPGTRQPSLATRTASPTASRPSVSASPSAAVLSSNAADRPLHERMSNFRNSVFGRTASSENRSSGSEADIAVGQTVESHRTGGDLDPPPEQSLGSSERTGSLDQSPTLSVSESPIPVPDSRTVPTGPTPARRDGVGGTPMIARRTLSPEVSETTLGQSSHGTAEESPSRANRLSVSEDFGARASHATSGRDREPTLLFSRKGPILSVETLGPRRIAVGKESAYTVTIQNSGDSAADDVVVLVDLPPWADVLAAEANTGATGSLASGDGVGPFQWKVGRLDAHSEEKLILRIVPRESRPFDLAVRWNYQPVASQALIEVQEPKLAIDLEGPKDVLFGEKELYKLRLSNTGTGDAENVEITLLPIGTGQNQPVSHHLGVLTAGEEKTIEVELTARQVGNLMIQVGVRGDGGLHAELAEEILVRRASLQIDVAGPQVQYVGITAGYSVRVRNPGTAVARNVELTASIPAGAKYVSGVEGAQLMANGTKVAWTVDELAPGQEKSFVLKCSLGLPGSSRMELVGKADGDLTASAGATTRVEAIADLKLEVKDPTGPVPVGGDATYELRVHNRGTKNARDIEIVVYFSRGIEPVGVEGGRHRIGPGQVIFHPLPSLVAKGEVAFRILAKADEPGNHTFRAEVHCKSLGTKLVSEETTHFYLDATPAMATPAAPGERDQEATLPATASTRPAVGPTPARKAPIRTAQRPSEPTAEPLSEASQTPAAVPLRPTPPANRLEHGPVPIPLRRL